MRLSDGGRGIDRGGLAQVQAAAGTLVVFSTAPGNVAADGGGPNSPFTAALLKHIETPGAEIRQVLADVRRDVRAATNGKQVPWEQSAMEGALFLKPLPATARSPGTEPSAPPSARGLEAETLFWDSVRNTSNPAELEAYLARFPSGVFVDLARARLAAFAKPAAPLQVPELSPQERMVSAMPAVDPSARQQLVREYLAAEKSKALAISIETGETDWTASWPDGARAMEVALEGCQVRTGKPCTPFAVDTEIQPRDSSGEWPRRDMPRVRYDGFFSPAQIPRLRDAERSGAAVAGYRAAAEPKAMAFHPRGLVFAVTGAASDADAQEQALAACNGDPGRKGQGGPCYLYAADNRVVLPQRLTKPLQTADFARRFEQALPLLNPDLRSSIARRYATGHIFKALALGPNANDVWYQADWDTPEKAELITLEKCQLYFGAPCRLFALGETILSNKDAVRDMPRLRYDGPFDPAQIPTLSYVVRQAPTVTSYAATQGPKALALHATGSIYTSVAPTQAEAEDRALAKCNDAQHGQYGRCFLYASGDRVVLPGRFVRPGMTEAAVAADLAAKTQANSHVFRYGHKRARGGGIRLAARQQGPCCLPRAGRCLVGERTGYTRRGRNPCARGVSAPGGSRMRACGNERQGHSCRSTSPRHPEDAICRFL